MNIASGARVMDRKGKALGTVGAVIRDSWTGEIKKFTVRTENILDELIYSPEDVDQATDEQIKLKVEFNKPVDLTIEIGARVVDKNGHELGMVDYIINDSYSGKVTGFRVGTGTEEGLFYSMEDILSMTTTEIKLKAAV